MTTFIKTVLFFFIFTQGVLGADQVALNGDKWQVLPSNVIGVTVELKGRVWFEIKDQENPWVINKLSSSGSGVDTDFLKKKIKEQFFKGSPCLVDCRPVLFEPNGRVWFVSRPSPDMILIGFDGERWVECENSEDLEFTGCCRNNAKRGIAGYNQYFKNTAFFMGRKGVHDFNGEKWSYTALIGENDGVGSHIKELYPLREDNALFVSARIRDATKFWRWDGGKWNKVIHSSPTSQLLTPWSKNRFWVQTPEGVELVSLNKKDPLAATVLLDRLENSKDDQARDTLIQALIDIGIDYRSDIEEALSKTLDPILIKSLIAVSKGMKNAGMVLRLNGYRLEQNEFLFLDALGRAFISSKRIVRPDETVVKEGLAIISSRDQVNIAPGAVAVSELRKAKGEVFTAYWKNALWLSGDGMFAYPRMLDLHTGQIVSQGPDLSSKRVLGVTPLGRVFLSEYISSGSWPQGYPIGVFTPYASSVEKRLVKTIIGSWESYQINTRTDYDGCVWIFPSKRTSKLYDGKELFESGLDLNFYSMVAGRNRSALTRDARGNACFINGAKVYKGKSIQSLVERHIEVIQDLFSPPKNNYESKAHLTQLVADKNGLVWFKENASLSVYYSGAWRNNLYMDGETTRQKGIRSVFAIGHSGSVCVLKLSNHRHQVGGYLGSVINTDIHLKSTGINQILTENVFTNQKGELWFSARVNSRADHAVRLTPGKKLKVFDRCKAPVCWERDGDLLLSCKNPYEFRIVRDNAVVQTINLPHGGTKTIFGSPCSGAIFAWTPGGIYRLKRMEQTSQKLYKIDGRYFPPIMKGRNITIGYSDLGFYYATAERTEDGSGIKKESFQDFYKIELPLD